MIDKNLPVRLKKHAHFKSNFYHPRIYQPGELPPELLSDDLVTQEKASLIVSSFTKSSAFPDTEVKLTVEEPISNVVSYNSSEVAIVKSKLSINKATVTELAGAGIPMNSAKEIIKEREKEKFTDIASLSKVTLPKGKTWSSFESQLVFE